MFVFASECGLAQADPSTDEIVRALQPTVAMMDGIRPATVAPSEPNRTAAMGLANSYTPAAHSVPENDGQNSLKTPSISLYVQFRTGSAELTPDTLRTLDKLGQALSSTTLTNYRFRIEGHTDTVGDRQLNQKLSEHRAAAVAEYLSRKFGINGSHLQAVGIGQSQLLIPTPEQTPEPRNRRVQVVNIGM